MDAFQADAQKALEIAMLDVSAEIESEEVTATIASSSLT
jgi:hypothetical protein